MPHATDAISEVSMATKRKTLVKPLQHDTTRVDLAVTRLHEALWAHEHEDQKPAWDLVQRALWLLESELRQRGRK